MSIARRGPTNPFNLQVANVLSCVRLIMENDRGKEHFLSHCHCLAISLSFSFSCCLSRSLCCCAHTKSILRGSQWVSTVGTLAIPHPYGTPCVLIFCLSSFGLSSAPSFTLIISPHFGGKPLPIGARYSLLCPMPSLGLWFALRILNRLLRCGTQRWVYWTNLALCPIESKFKA